MTTTLFQNKKCLLTGAASGIGKATALLLAENGAELFLTDINTNGLQETVDAITKKGGKVSAH